MRLSEKHYLPRKSDRECKFFHPIYKMGSKSKKEFDRVERVLDEVTCDIVNGISKSDILLKLQDGSFYENQTKGIGLDRAYDYYNAALSRLQIDEPEKNNARQVFYAMYLNLYKEQLEDGNTMAAKQTLDSMVKLMGLDKQNPTTAVQINTGDEKVEINFGFKENEN